MYRLPVIGEESIGEYKPPLLPAFDVVGPLEEPALETVGLYLVCLPAGKRLHVIRAQ